MSENLEEEKKTKVFSKEQLETAKARFTEEARYFASEEAKAGLKAMAFGDARVKEESGIAWAEDELKKIEAKKLAEAKE